jgi:hypothetical protein
MTTAHLTIWFILLTGSLSLCELLARARVLRVDHRATVLAGGLAGLACVSIVSVYGSVA